MASGSNSPTGSIINTPAPSRIQSDASGSITHTVSKPSTPSEWQLYTVLQRANLLQYYDTFISQGGDDVHQLLEAGEEEFLEIMALVGMASKPLHVRRLQKGLQEYARHGLLQPLMSPAGPTPPSLPTIIPTKLSISTNCESSPAAIEPPANAVGWMQAAAAGATANVLPGAYLGSLFQPPVSAEGFTANHYNDNGTSLFPSEPYPTGSTSPSLTMAQIDKIRECAAEVAMTIPEVEPKLVQNKKKVSRDLLAVMEMSHDHPHRMEEFRRYAAIYGRFDAKRKADKPLTLHEVSVNEAAAQLCLMRPALLTRRDELFPMARQIVRDAGYNYAKGQSSSRNRQSDTEIDEPAYKRSTPADSVTSSGDERAATPSSSCAGETGGAASPPSVDNEAHRQILLIQQEINNTVIERDTCQEQATYAGDAAIESKLRLRAHSLDQKVAALRHKHSKLVQAQTITNQGSTNSPLWPAFSSSEGSDSFAVVKEELPESEDEDHNHQ